MLFRFLIILALTFAVFFLFRWWRGWWVGRAHLTSHDKQKQKTDKIKRGTKLIRDPKTGEYRPQRDDDDE